MLNQSTVIGYVTDMVADRDATLLIVRTGGGVKRDGGGKWEEHVACRFWGKDKKWIEGIGKGQLVKIDGSARSRKGDKGGWFTSFEARYLQKVAIAGATPATREQSRSVPDAEVDGPSGGNDDGSDIPF